MTLTVELTPEQVDQLNREAAGHGLPVQVMLQRLLSESLSHLAPLTMPSSRILGLHAGEAWIADDFDAPLPDSFWLGEDTNGK